MSKDTKPIHRLDLKGLKCPLPALKTRKALLALGAGEKIDVICTDPLARIDIPHLVATLGDEMITQHEDAETIIFSIRRQAAKA
jgi:tRNA 2-thiouridine synthesizing protein A